MDTNSLFANKDKSLSEKDIGFLMLLYQNRCLCTISGAYQHYFSKIVPHIAYCEDRLLALYENGLIDMIDYPPEEQEVIFLTQPGIDYLKTCVARNQNPIFSAMKSARQLRVNGRMIKHQIAVNTTAFDLLDIADKKGLKCQYYDKLFASAAFGNIPCDGMLILDDRIVLVKNDTGSMRGVSLYHQWGAFCDFIDNLPPYFKNYAITILIVFNDDDNDDARSETRRHSIAQSVCISRLFLYLRGKVDLYAVSRNQACNLLENGFDSQETNSELFHDTVQSLVQNYQFSYLAPNHYFNESGYFCSSYLFYRACSDRHLVVEDGRSVDYLIDFWFDGRLSALREILNNETAEKMLKESRIQREIPYVVVVPDMRTVLRIMALPGIPKLHNVYFTTPDRIKKRRSFPESLFRIDESLCVWSFRNNSLKDVVFERKLSPNTKRKG